MAVYRLRKEQKDYARSMTLSYRFGPDWFEWDQMDSISVTYTFYPPNVRVRDDDNFVASMKGARDGIALALDVDDSIFVTQPVEWGEVEKGRGRVVVTLEEMEE
jgi:hypothetical protein